MRASVFLVALAVLVGGCHGSGSSVLPVGPPVFNNNTAAAAIAFRSLGPTHMTSGFVPTSGKVNAYAVDPKNPNVMYSASGKGTGLETYSSAGIYRTRDGGKTWGAVDNGLTDRSGVISSVVNSLWLDPDKPNVLLAATEYDGIFQSTDGGSSWHSAYRTTRASQFASFGGKLYATSAAGILVSLDDGTSWNVSFRADSAYPTAFGAISSTSGSVFVAGFSNGTILRFGEDERWTRVGRLPFDPHTGTDGSSPVIHQIAIDPLRPSLAYASSNDGRWDQNLFASKDEGATWVKVVPHFGKYSYYNVGLGTQAIAFSQVHPHLLYIGVDGGLLYINADGRPNPAFSGYTSLSVIDIRNVWTLADGKDDRCWIASDQGLDTVRACTSTSHTPRDNVVSKSAATGLARRFAISPDGETIVTSLQDFNSHVTSNAGTSWHEEASNSFALYEDGFNELQPGNPRTCYAFDEASGFLVSTDGCRTYASPSHAALTLFPSRLMTTPMAFAPNDPTLLYVVSGSIVGAGFPPAPKAVYATTDGGRTFRKLPWPVNEPGMIVIDPHDASHVIVGDLGAQKRSSLRVTFDGGKTWATSRGVPATPFWYAATISPANGNTVLATSVDAGNNIFVLRSTNGGRTFARVATVANAPLTRGPVDRDLARHLTEPPPAFVYSPARQILFNPASHRERPYVALTTLRGAFLSTDDGSTWRRLDRDLIAHSFWGIRWLNGYLYLGSDGQGIVKSTHPLQ